MKKVQTENNFIGSFKCGTAVFAKKGCENISQIGSVGRVVRLLEK